MNQFQPINISIIVPLYNKVNEVCRSIDSILQQTIQNFELIIVDGGSTDGSLEIIQPYLTDKRITLIHQKSKGLPAGRNEGISVARYDLIAFLDADDEWCPTFLEKIISLNRKYPYAGLYATAYATQYESHLEKPRLVDIPDAPWEGIIPSYFRSSALAFIYPFAPCCVAIPKSTFDEIGYFNPNLRTGEDSEMWGRIALELPIAFTSEIGAKYSAVASNKMTDHPSVMVKHPFLDFLETYPKKKLENHSDYTNILLYIQKEEIAIALNNLYAKSPKQARKNLKNITCKEFMKYKYIILVLSYLPISILRIVLPIANRVGRKNVK